MSTARERAQAAEERPPICAAALDVHVVDALGHDPVGGAYVSVNQPAGGSTNQHGQIKFDRLCPGEVVVDVVHAAYQSAHRAIVLGNSASLEIALAPLIESVTIVEKAPPPVDMRSSAAITGTALERKRGQSLSETLAEVPGVSLLRSSSGAAKPIVRGQFGRRLPMLVDGIRHRAQDWGLDHAPEIDPAIADRITVVRGASGVRYGSDAIGGAAPSRSTPASGCWGTTTRSRRASASTSWPGPPRSHAGISYAWCAVGSCRATLVARSRTARIP